MAQSHDPEKILIEMYSQLMHDVNRHIIIVWQSICMLIAAITAFALIKDNLFSLDMAASVALIACIWLLAHVYDASFWYNRNIVIIANIEQQFLRQDDGGEMKFFFSENQPKGVYMSHCIQRALGISVAVLVLGFQFYETILPILLKQSKFEIFNAAPWIIAACGGLIWAIKASSNVKKYNEFIKNSSGLTDNTDNP